MLVLVTLILAWLGLDAGASHPANSHHDVTTQLQSGTKSSETRTSQSVLVLFTASLLHPFIFSRVSCNDSLSFKITTGMSWFAEER
jgi:hypothetical protein